MKKRKEPFTDPAQLGKLNEEVWKTLEEGHEIPEEMKSDAKDAEPPSPSAVAGDEAGSPRRNA